MTVPSTTSRVTYAGDGGSVAFPVSFYFLANADLVVLLVDGDGISTTQVLNTNYTVAGAGNEAGGTVTMLVAPPSGYTLIIYRDPAVTQLTDYAPNDPFPAETHERALDRLTMISQRNRELVTRSIRLPDSDTSGASTSLPAPSARKALIWSADELSIINSTVDPDAVATQAQSSADAAAVSAAAALASENAAAETYDAFDDRYLGSKAVEPTLDNDGDALLNGAIYFNSVTNKLRIYNGSAWQDTAVPTPASFTSNVYSGTGAQTAFTLSTIPGSVASVFVFISGVAQRPTTDYSISGSTLTFVAAPASGTNNVLAFVASTVAAGTPDNDSVSTVKIQANAVTTAKIADSNVTLAKLASAAYGTSGANKLLQLDADGKLPALDGSQLTGIVSVVPGTIIDYAGTSAPSGYLVCPTSQTNISRTTYAALFAAIGTTWGAGDGSTTFGLPWFAADYAAVQANSNVGTASVGQVIAHVHVVGSTATVNTGKGANVVTSGGTGKNTASTGGSANLAAGVRVLKCIKY